MNVKLHTRLLLFIFITVFAACGKSASKLYDTGNYDEAVDQAVKKLQKKPGDEESKQTLKNAYRFAVDNHESQVKTLSESSNELKWEHIYGEYTALQGLYNKIRQSPEAFNAVKPTDYSSYLTTYASKAADVRVERGMRWMEKKEKADYKNAYTEFNEALRFKPEDFDIKTKADEAYQGALTNVVVMPMDNYRYRTSSYTDKEFKDFENSVLRKLQSSGGSTFIKYYSESEARTKNIRTDHFIDFRFNTQNTGKVKDEESLREVSSDVVIKETVYRPDSVVKEYKKVFAKITTTKRVLTSDGNVLVNIRDVNGRRIWSDDVQSTHTWKTEFAAFTGDERALSDSDKELVNRTRQTPPEEKDILKNLFTEINNNLYTKVRDFYRRQ